MKIEKVKYVLILIIFVIFLSSCSTYFFTCNYLQLLQVKPINNQEQMIKTENGLLYENVDCRISYQFWSDGGNAGFVFYNKTDKIIYLDLSRTFFVKNGIAYDYYVNKTITEQAATNSTSSTFYSLFSTNIYSSSITKENITGLSLSSSPIIYIPPKASKVINNFSLLQEEFISCDLKHYPTDSVKITFTEDNSPIIFSNYITFRVGDNSPLQNIENKFYVSEITNYVKQGVTEYIKRETCENILTSKEIYELKYTHTPEIFDAYITVEDATSFYKIYKGVNNDKSYHRKYSIFYWDDYYKGYLYH